MTALASTARQRHFFTFSFALALTIATGEISQSLAQNGPMPNQWAQHNQAAFAASGNTLIPTYSPHGMPVLASAEQLQSQMAAGQAAMVGDLDRSYEFGPDQNAIDGGTYAMNCWVTAQRYDDHVFDFRAEALYMTRDTSYDTDLLLTTDGAGLGAMPALSTGDAPLDTDELGVRLTAAVEFAHSFDVEFIYIGCLNWQNSAQATSGTDSLFSVFSRFGIDPGPGVGNGFVATDQASLHGFEYETNLDSFELNIARFRWVAVNSSFAGSWIFGIRYIRVNEHLYHFTRADAHLDTITGLPRGPGSLDYFINVENNMIGFQTGGELSVSPLPGMIVGAEVKAGIYGNRVKNNTNIIVTPNLPSVINEQTIDETAAFAGEANVSVVYRLFHEVYLRAGYQALFVTDLGLGPDNFNTAVPFTGGAPRATFVDATGQTLWHGANAGIEWQF
jgi:hypothetical protein